MSLTEFNSAVRMRETIQQIAATTIDYIYPEPRYATVVAIDAPARRVTVKYPDESATFTLPVGSVIPTNIGSLVRVAGRQGARYVDEVLDSAVTFSTLRLLGTQDASLSSTGHPFQIGLTNGNNIIIDGNEIMARNNGAVSTLNLNADGGLVLIGANLGSGEVLQLGNDTKFVDVNAANALGLYGLQNNAAGELRLGTVATRVGTDGSNSWLLSGAGYLHLRGIGNLYLDGDTTWLRNTAGGLRGYINTDGIGLYGTRSIYFADYGGGWFMQDATWIRAVNDKYVYTGGVIACNTGFSGRLGGGRSLLGTAFDHAFYGMSGFQDQVRIMKPLTDIGTDRPWYDSQLIIQATNGNTGTHSACIALWVNGTVAGLAPVISCYEGGGLGEVISFTNNPNTGYVSLVAAGYLIGSSERTKHDIAPVSSRLIDRCRTVRAKTWKRNAPAMETRLSDSFVEENVRRRQFGFKERTPTEADRVSVPHDCEVHGCNGTRENPCSIVHNQNGTKIGLVAEDVYEVLPEIVAIDDEHKPVAIDVGGLAGVAWEMVLELADEVAALRAEIEALKAKK